ncbi:MAG TPA: glycosyl hydrolase [Opitutus sp.]|nr:glycosyl hydrolase [Opitutus sp.]
MVIRTVSLKRAGFYLLSLLTSLTASTAHAVDTYEAEAARLTGTLRVETAVAGFSGAGYVAGFQSSNENIWFDTVAAPAFGLYELTLGYRSPFGEKKTRLHVNGQGLGEVTLAGTTEFKEVAGGKVLLNQGNNVIRVESNWGWYEIDYIKIAPAAKRAPHQVDKLLINPNATVEAKALMSFLVDHYGKAIVSGQQDTRDLNYIVAQTGELPGLLGLDMMDYSPSRVERGTTSTATETGIDWWANQRGIVTYCWHWNAPKGLLDTPEQRWWSGFYTSATTFDVAYAMNNPSSEDYALLLRDIDAIAVQLKRLQDAKVPVLWRPLHEAEGGWFWWGAKGPEACKALWRVMYDRLTNLHGLNNLIWVWNSINPAWYPGDEYVDIVSMDSYPGNFNYTAQSGSFDRLVALTGHEKLIAMTENGPIPDPDLIQVYDAPWSWFCTWNGFPQSANSVAHLQKVYHHPFVLTLDELPLLAAYPLTSFGEVQGFLDRFVQSGAVSGEVVSTLKAKLAQASQHEAKGHTKQAVKHLEDFQKHLAKPANAGSITEAARTELHAYAGLLIAELSR